MFHEGQYPEMLEERGLEATPNRLGVLEAIGRSNHPLKAKEIISRVNRSDHRSKDVNKVTVYRILDLLVEKGLITRISSGDRSFRYGIGPAYSHQSHPHFFCTLCGRMECLEPEELGLDFEALARGVAGDVRNVEIRVDGTCRKCLKNKPVD